MSRCSRLAAVVVAALCVVLPGCVAGNAPRGHQLTVMTRNLYLGSGLTNLFRAGSLPELAAAGERDWATVQATDFRTRAGALADEIATARPDVVALQEVTLWRDQVPGDLPRHAAPDATHVVLDLLAVLRHALAARGIPYTAVATSTNADLEVPRPGRAGDLRITDRDVLLVRADEAEQFTNPRTGHYAAVLHLPLVTGPIANTRGWVAADYRPDRDTTVRIIATHLEVTSGGGGPIEEQQATELRSLVAASSYPVIVLGDGNSPADGSATRTYATLTRGLHDAWSRAHPGDPGPTCCQAELLDNPRGRQNRRIDLVLSSENWPVDRVARTGAKPFRATPPPLWASDHFGVTARFTLP